MLPVQAAILALLLIPVAGCSQTEQNYRTLSPAEAMEMIRVDTSLVLLDVRTPQEFAGEAGHLQGALLLPVQELEERSAELAPLKDRPILVYCRSGSRSSRASELLAAQGFKIFMVDGGMLAWNKAGLPTTHETAGGNAE